MSLSPWWRIILRNVLHRPKIRNDIKNIFYFLHFNFHSSNFCAIILDMDKSTLQTIAIIAAVVVASWAIGGQVQAIGGQVQANSAAMADLRDDMRELRGLLIFTYR